MARRSSTATDDGLDRAVAVRAARMFYLHDRSKVEIAERLGVSRFKVARLLEYARATGLVRIEVEDYVDEDLSAAVRESLGLDHAIAVVGDGDADEIRHTVGRAAAELLSTTLRDGEVLGLGWGRSLSATAQELGELPRVSVVQLTGATEMTRHLSPVEVVRAIGVRSGGDVIPIFAPLLADDATTAAAFRRQPAIARAFSLFDEVTTAVMSIGSWNPPVSQLEDIVEEDTQRDLLQRGIVAELGVTLVNAEGRAVAPEFSERCIAISADQLRRIPRIIGVASGERKSLAVRALARGGWITELVIDDALAQALRTS